MPLRLSVIVICFLWTLPTAGLFVSSFRNPQLITQTGWWTALIHPFEQGWTLQNYQQVLSANGMGDALWIVASLLTLLIAGACGPQRRIVAFYNDLWLRPLV